METSAQFWSILKLSLQVSGTAVLISSFLGIPLGTWLGMSQFRGKSLVAGVIHTGTAFPPVVVGLVLYLLLSRSGPLGDWGWLFTPLAMVLAQTVLCLPFVVGITMAAIATVPPELSWQLRTLGATPRQVRQAVIREARDGILLAVATAFGRSLSEVGAVWMVGGNIQGQTRVLTTSIVLETGQGRFHLALWMGGALLAVALIINLLIVRSRWLRPAWRVLP